ncbi:MAG: hypothetical protein AAB594_01945 [Patescibacteria group bacterium]
MTKKQITIFVGLYLLFGLINQAYSCKISVDPEDPFPCAGIIWTPVVLLGWPLFGIFDLIHGFIVRGVLILLAFTLTIVIPNLLFRVKNDIPK